MEAKQEWFPQGQGRAVRTKAALALVAALWCRCKISGVMVRAHAQPGLRTETRAGEQMPCGIVARSQNRDLGDSLPRFRERSLFPLMREKSSFPLTGD